MQYTVSLGVLVLAASVIANIVLLFTSRRLTAELADARKMLPALEAHVRRGRNLDSELELEHRTKMFHQGSQWEKRVAELELALSERANAEALRLTEAKNVAYMEGQDSVWKQFRVDVQPFLRVESSKVLWKKATEGHTMSLMVNGMPTLWTAERITGKDIEFDEKAAKVLLDGLNGTIREVAGVLDKLPTNFLPAKVLSS